ncbi:YciI family protein [Paenibacillus sp. Soil522]|uniref:YciI family protein n=1 Tax=Paenibacillus sp. Soil522 TaxID=1736388 RepID=UPI0006F91878|nr:hypothetical protein ASG81_16070 [Paenibacillus sp. Soil522]
MKRTYYGASRFIASGLLKPRTCGVIIARAESKTEIEEIIKEDPFHKEKLAEYTVIPFTPTIYAESLASLLGGGI